MSALGLRHARLPALQGMTFGPWRGRRALTWLLLTILGWVALVLLAAWVGRQNGYWWDVAKAPLDALVGVVAGAVLAGLLVDPVKRWIGRLATARAEQEWLRDHCNELLFANDALCHLGALLVERLYDTVVSTGALTEVIPGEALRWDMLRRPRVPSGLQSVGELAKALADSLNDIQLNSQYGAAAVARTQVERIRAVLATPQEDHGCSAYGDQGDRTPASAPIVRAGGRKLPVPEDQIRRLDDAAVVSSLAHCLDKETGDYVAAVSGRMLTLCADLVGAREFDPVPLRDAVVALVIRAERFRATLTGGNWGRSIFALGETKEAPDLSTREGLRECAKQMMATLGSALDAVEKVRAQLFKSTAALMRAAAEIGGVAAVKTLPELPIDGVLMTAGEWELWARMHHLWFDWADERKSSATLT